MKLIVGLGNPGKIYEGTRHNLGFMIAERFLKDYESSNKTLWENNTKFKSDIAQLDWQPKSGKIEKVIIAKPKTYMNNSGLAVKLATSYWQLATSDIWVIYDDIDLPLGSIKIRFGGASAGHKGVESVIKALGTDQFWRFRLGIGEESSKLKVKSSKLKNVEDYVLGKFKPQERGKVKEIIKRGAKAIEFALEENLEAAMNRFNTK